MKSNNNEKNNKWVVLVSSLSPQQHLRQGTKNNNKQTNLFWLMVVEIPAQN